MASKRLPRALSVGKAPGQLGHAGHAKCWFKVERGSFIE